MKIRVLLFLVAVFLIVSTMFAGCAEEQIVYASIEAATFYTFEEFEKSVGENAVKANANDIHALSEVSYYYLPSPAIQNIALSEIYVKDRYVCLYYFTNENKRLEQVSSVDAELDRIANTIKLEWVRFEDGELLLENTIETLSLKELGNGVYYTDITYPTQPDVILSKSLYWVHDGYRFNLDIPMEMYNSMAVETDFVSTITELVKVEIGK